MNRKLLQKILTELEKEAPNIDYVRGILETVMESLPEVPVNDPALYQRLVKTMGDNPEMSEKEIMDAKARAAIKTVKELTEQGTQETNAH